MNYRLAPIAAILAAAMLVIVNCNQGDKVAPEGAIIDLAATPTTIVTTTSPTCTGLLGIAKCGTSDVVATVSSPVGVPLPDQDVRFTNTAGLLFTGTVANPQRAANLPIRTDSFGNAHVNLITGSTTTVNARSGKATGALTLTTTTANIGRIDLTQDPTGAACGTAPEAQAGLIDSCSAEICLVATILDVNGVGIPDLPITFRLQNPTGANAFTGSFSRQPSTSDANGDAITVLRPSSSNCGTQCGGNQCSGIDVVASTQGGFDSNILQFGIAIP
jgi:hypothetical protein